MTSAVTQFLMNAAGAGPQKPVAEAAAVASDGDPVSQFQATLAGILGARAGAGQGKPGDTSGKADRDPAEAGQETGAEAVDAAPNGTQESEPSRSADVSEAPAGTDAQVLATPPAPTEFARTEVDVSAPSGDPLTKAGAPSAPGVVNDEASPTQPATLEAPAPDLKTALTGAAAKPELTKPEATKSELSGSAVKSGPAPSPEGAKLGAGAPGRSGEAGANPAAAVSGAADAASGPKPSEVAAQVADEMAMFKRAGSEAGLEQALRGDRGAADAALVRSPGDLVRAAAREAGSEPGKPVIDGPAKSDAAAPAPGAKPAAAPAPAVQAPIMAALMAAAARPALETGLTSDAGADGLVQTDADLTLEQAGTRTDGRVEAQRNALPSAANAHAAARFQPHTVQTMAARIAAKAVDGARIFDIRMDPAELGRVEVRLELGGDNSVRALLSAERAETLAELQRSARDLEKALAEAGLDLAEDGLSFSLSDERPGAEGEGDAVFSPGGTGDAEDAPLDAAQARPGTRFYGFDLAARSGLDVRI